MTRVNVVAPSLLSDQHLIAEYREIVRLPASLRRSLASKTKMIIPSSYTMGTGHVKFFYDKLGYICRRHASLCDEMLARNYRVNMTMDSAAISEEFPSYFKDWEAAPGDLSINLEGLVTRINEKPNLYTWNRKAREDMLATYTRMMNFS